MDILPGSTRKPGAYIGFDTRIAQNSLPANRQKVLILAQRLDAGTVAALVPTPTYSDKDAALYCGAGSPAHLMAEKAIKNNPLIDLTIVTVNDAVGSAAATGPFTLAGEATSSGTLKAWVGDRDVEFAIAAGDDETTIAATLDTMLKAIAAKLPVTTAAVAGVVTCTARSKGPYGNGIKLAIECDAAGITATAGTMTGGLVAPDITDALEAVFGVRYHIIVSQFTDADNLTLLRDHCNNVSDKIEQRGTRAYYSMTGAMATATTQAAALNAARTRLPYIRGTYTHESEVAAGYAGYRAAIEDPAMPLDGDTIVGIHIPAVADRLSRIEQEACLHNGVTPLEVDSAGNVRIVRNITNYLVDPDNNPDEALLDESAIDTLDYTRDVIRAIPRPKKISSKTLSAFRDLVYAALKRLETAEILVDVDLYEPRLVVEKYPSRVGWVRLQIPSPVIPGWHITDGTIELYL